MSVESTVDARPGRRSRIFVLTAVAMIAFAGNSLLCRIALRDTGIDPASFTSLRLLSGAAVLGLIVQLRYRQQQGGGDWFSAFALFVYAAGFSFAYLSLSAATGALLLFGAVQATMIGFGLFRGERLSSLQVSGLVLALVGLVVLLLPGLSAPPLRGTLLMLAAGVAWAAYTLRGKRGGDATRVTAGNFLRAVPLTLLLSAFFLARANFDVPGVACALASGALTSGLGYAIWYTALPALKSTHAATVQLSVPVIAALGGIILLGESISLRFVLAAIAILGGIALVILERTSTRESAPRAES